MCAGMARVLQATRFRQMACWMDLVMVVGTARWTARSEDALRICQEQIDGLAAGHGPALRLRRVDEYSVELLGLDDDRAIRVKVPLYSGKPELELRVKHHRGELQIYRDKKLTAGDPVLDFTPDTEWFEVDRRERHFLSEHVYLESHPESLHEERTWLGRLPGDLVEEIAATMEALDISLLRVDERSLLFEFKTDVVHRPLAEYIPTGLALGQRLAQALEDAS